MFSLGFSEYIARAADLILPFPYTFFAISFVAGGAELFQKGREK